MKKVLVGCFSAFFLLISLCAHAGTWTSGNTTITTSGSTVTVSGSGAMADYSYSFEPAWMSSSITSIVIEEGVTYLGSYAFIDDQSNVVDVTIPKSVTSIGANAFASCLKMANIHYAGSPNEWAFMEKIRS